MSGVIKWRSLNRKWWLVPWHITLSRLFNAKVILLEEQSWYYLTHSWEDTGVHTFHKGISPKVNVIVRLEYELAYQDSAVHRFNHYTMRTPRDNMSNNIWKWRQSPYITTVRVYTYIFLFITSSLNNLFIQYRPISVYSQTHPCW